MLNLFLISNLKRQRYGSFCGEVAMRPLHNDLFVTFINCIGIQDASYSRYYLTKVQEQLLDHLCFQHPGNLTT